MPYYEDIEEDFSQDILRMTPWELIESEILPYVWERADKVTQKHKDEKLGDFDEYGPSMSDRGDNYVSYSVSFPDIFFLTESERVDVDIDVRVGGFNVLSEPLHVDYVFRPDRNEAKQPLSYLIHGFSEFLDRAEKKEHTVLRCHGSREEFLEFVDKQSSNGRNMRERRMTWMVQEPEDYFMSQMPDAERIVEYAGDRGEITSKEVGELLDQTYTTIRRKLEGMSKAGILEKRKESGTNLYSLNSSSATASH